MLKLCRAAALTNDSATLALGATTPDAFLLTRSQGEFEA
jgi:hypothetical protein